MLKTNPKNYSGITDVLQNKVDNFFESKELKNLSMNNESTPHVCLINLSKKVYYFLTNRFQFNVLLAIQPKNLFFVLIVFQMVFIMNMISKFIQMLIPFVLVEIKKNLQ